MGKDKQTSVSKESKNEVDTKKKVEVKKVNTPLNDKKTDKQEKKDNKTVEKKDVEKKEVEKKEVKQVSKKSKFNEVEKGTRPNRETAYVNLELNVKSFKTWLKNYYTYKNRSPKMIGAHYILAAVNQVVCNNIVNGVSEKFKKNKTGMIDIEFDSLYNYINTTPYLRDTYMRLLDKFDMNTQYSNNMPTQVEKINEYIEKFVLHGNENLKMNKITSNLLYYILLQTNVLLADTAYYCAEYAGRTISSNAVVAAVKIHFSGKLLEDILRKTDDIITRLKNTTAKDQENNDDEEEELKKDKMVSKDDSETEVSDDDTENESDDDSSDEE